MSTCNFDHRNASKIFAVLNEENDEFMYEDEVGNVRDGLEAKFGKDYTELDKREENELRSFPSNVIVEVTGEIREYKKIDLNVFPVLEVVVRSGYYQGFNFDWNLKIDVQGELVDLEDVFEEVVDQTEQYVEFSEQGTERYAKYAQEFAEKSSQELIESVEKLLAEYTDTLSCIGVASNGEAFYKRCS